MSDESKALPIQSKALSKMIDVPLGTDINRLRTHWWIITVEATTKTPTSYIMTIDEVRTAAVRNVNAAGTVSYWLPKKIYSQSIYKEQWERLGNPEPEEPLLRSEADI